MSHFTLLFFVLTGSLTLMHASLTLPMWSGTGAPLTKRSKVCKKEMFHLPTDYWPSPVDIWRLMQKKTTVTKKLPGFALWRWMLGDSKRGVVLRSGGSAGGTGWRAVMV